MIAKTTRTASARVALCLAMAAVSACGIDQGGARAPVASQAPLVVLGPITGFGSVHVNGIVLESAAAEIRINGNPSAESQLKVGQVIRAVGSTSASVNRAVSVEYRANVTGPVEAVDPAAGRLSVLGQNIEADARTVLDLGGDGVADLTPGRRVEISGFEAPSGALRATFIGDAAASAPLQVTTDITGVDLATLTFDVGGLSVDYSQVMMLQLPSGVPEVGLVVEVRGTSLGPDGELVAELIRSLPAAPSLLGQSDIGVAQASFGADQAPAAATRANFIGFVESSNPPTTIAVGDIEVSLSATTVVTGGIQDDLQPGRLVQVLGEVSDLGTIEADHIVVL